MNNGQIGRILSIVCYLLPFAAAALIRLDAHRAGRKGLPAEAAGGGGLLLAALFLTVVSILLALYLRMPMADVVFLILPPLLAVLI